MSFKAEPLDQSTPKSNRHAQPGCTDKPNVRFNDYRQTAQIPSNNQGMEFLYKIINYIVFAIIEIPRVLTLRNLAEL